MKENNWLNLKPKAEESFKIEKMALFMWKNHAKIYIYIYIYRGCEGFFLKKKESYLKIGDVCMEKKRWGCFSIEEIWKDKES